MHTVTGCLGKNTIPPSLWISSAPYVLLTSLTLFILISTTGIKMPKDKEKMHNQNQHAFLCAFAATCDSKTETEQREG